MFLVLCGFLFLMNVSCRAIMSGCVASVISSRYSLFVFKDLMFHCKIVRLVLFFVGYLLFCVFIVGLVFVLSIVLFGFVTCTKLV